MLCKSAGNRQSVVFRNNAGLQLTGMLYLPLTCPRRCITAVMPVDSIKYRIGSFRYHHHLATVLADRGYVVLTFDPSGIGDSEGTLDHQPIESMFIAIQGGLYVDDTRCAIDMLCRELNCERFALIGICGGAVTSLLTMGKDARVVGAAMMAMPVLYDRKPVERGTAERPQPMPLVMSKRTARLVLEHKLRALCAPRIWRTMLRGEINVRAEATELLHAIAYFVTGRHRSHTAASSTMKYADSAAIPLSSHSRFNTCIQSAMSEMWNGDKRLLFVNGSLDLITGIFEDEFLGPACSRYPSFRDKHEYRVIANANHMFSGEDSQHILTATVANWMARVAASEPAGPPCA